MLIALSPLAQAFPSSAKVEGIEELGFGFRRVRLAIPVQVEFENVGHFKYLYDRDKKLCQLGTCSISPSGGFVIFQEAASGNLFLYRRRGSWRRQLTDKFVALARNFEWNEYDGMVEVRFETGTTETYTLPPL